MVEKEVGGRLGQDVSTSGIKGPRTLFGVPFGQWGIDGPRHRRSRRLRNPGGVLERDGVGPTLSDVRTLEVSPVFTPIGPDVSGTVVCLRDLSGSRGSPKGVGDKPYVLHPPLPEGPR